MYDTSVESYKLSFFLKKSMLTTPFFFLVQNDFGILLASKLWIHRRNDLASPKIQTDIALYLIASLFILEGLLR
jgi:hypothetical protein